MIWEDQMKEEEVFIFYFFIYNIELIIDNNYNEFMKFHDVLYDAELPTNVIKAHEKDKKKQKGLFG